MKPGPGDVGGDTKEHQAPDTPLQGFPALGSLSQLLLALPCHQADTGSLGS